MTGAIHVSRPTPSQAAAAARHRQWFRPALKPVVVAVPILSVVDAACCPRYVAELNPGLLTEEAELRRAVQAIGGRIEALRVELKSLKFSQVGLAKSTGVRPGPRVSEIQKMVAKFYKVLPIDICSARRYHNVLTPRHVAMYLCRKFTLRSLVDIGRRFGGRDHTTCINAIRNITARRLIESELDAALKFFEAQLTLDEVAHD